jgi:hypothetical protein
MAKTDKTETTKAADIRIPATVTKTRIERKVRNTDTGTEKVNTYKVTLKGDNTGIVLEFPSEQEASKAFGGVHWNDLLDMEMTIRIRPSNAKLDDVTQ